MPPVPAPPIPFPEVPIGNATVPPPPPLPAPAPTPSAALPAAKEMVTLRLDREVLEHFQADGPGWQERINNALRAAAGK